MLDGGVLVASANSALREKVRRSLHDQSWTVQEVSGGADALAKLESGDWQLLFLDQRLPDLDAEEVMQIINVRFPGIQVVILDSDGGPIPPFSALGTGHLRSWLDRQIPQPNEDESARPHLLGKAAASSEEVPPLPGMIGTSEKMQRLYRLARLVAPRNTTVLLLGATGTGKELVARAIHQLSSRSGGALVVVNCAAIPETLLESELFGFSRGAFTGAVQAYAGRIHAAQGGTLFLDEIGEMPLSLQAKLLRFLEQKEVQRLGNCDPIRVDVRVVAATNAALERQVEAGRFRQDLYYRLSAFPVELPALTERGQDIVPLALHFLKLAGSEFKTGSPALSQEAIRKLEAHGWPGNVRELQQVIERAAILADGADSIRGQHLHFSPVPRNQLRREKSAEWGPT
jgi:DNA-binding NtrC family response regulator